MEPTDRVSCSLLCHSPKSEASFEVDWARAVWEEKGMAATIAPARTIPQGARRRMVKEAGEELNMIREGKGLAIIHYF